MANLSMIHDERKVPVFDLASRRTVGTLDESFVVGMIHPGSVFITKGQLWRVLDTEEGRITVEPAKRAKGELPSWEGEQIPVPFAVAQEVGALRRTRRFGDYLANPHAARYAAGFLEGMDRDRAVIPSDRTVTLENAEEGVVCNICAGHRANEVIARVLSLLLSARYGTTVGIEIDAYRCLLRLPKSLRAAEVREALVGLEPAHIRGLLDLGLKRTALYKWKLVQVAKKFGAIDPDADYERLSIHRLSALFDRTVVQRETYRELFENYMDVEAAAGIVAAIRDGAIEIVTTRVSVLGAAGLFSSRDLIPPESADTAILATVRRRIEDSDVILCCMNCRKWRLKTKVSRVDQQPQCPVCTARLIAALKPWDEPLCAVANKKEKSPEEREVEKRLLRNANIVLSSGRKAVIALAGRGVGPEHASRILATLTEGDAFYKEILKAERQVQSRPGTSGRRETVRDYSHDRLELLLEEVEAPLDVLEVLAAGQDDLARAEEERDDLGVLDPVDEPGELLGLVLDVLEVERDHDLVEVDVLADVVRADDVRDRNARLVVAADAGLAKRGRDDPQAVGEGLVGPGSRSARPCPS